MVKSLAVKKLDDLIKFILLARYRSLSPCPESKSFCSFKILSNILGISPSSVRRVCVSYFKSKKINDISDLAQARDLLADKRRSRSIQSKLSQSQIDYITDQETLVSQVSMSLAQRAAQFANDFGLEKFTSTQLYTIYRQNGISYKLKKITKQIQPQQRKEFLESLKLAKKQIKFAKQAKTPIIFLDEIMFTSKSQRLRDFSNMYQNIEIDYKKNYIQPVAVCAAINYDIGVLHHKAFAKSVNIAKFLDFMTEVRQMIKSKRVYVFMDNLRVHTSDRTTSTLKKMGFIPIWNATYAPEYQPIELVFSQVKRVYKNLYTHALVNNQRKQVRRFINQAFDAIEHAFVQKAIDHCLEELHKYVQLNS